MYLFKLNIVRIKLAAVLQSTDSKMYAKSWLNSIQMWQIVFDFLTCFTFIFMYKEINMMLISVFT